MHLNGCLVAHAVKWLREPTQILNLKSGNWSPITLDLLCLDFTKVDPSKTGKENVLVMTDAFSKFSVAVVTPNQKALTVAKALVEKWFHMYGIPSRIHSDQGRSFDNEVIRSLCKLYGVQQSLTCPYNPRGNAQCERFNRMMFGLLCTLSKEQKAEWPVIFRHWSSRTTRCHIQQRDSNPTS